MDAKECDDVDRCYHGELSSVENSTGKVTNWGKLLPAFGFNYTTWKVSKYGVSSGQNFPVFNPNTGKYEPEKLRIWTLFKQC